jgi:membrane fusion protein (multidrug efflux system)
MRPSRPTRVLTLSLAVALLAACGGEKPADGAAGGGPPGGMPPLPVEVATATEQTINAGLNTVGSLRADETVVVRPEVTGRIERIHFTEGGHVSEGQPLFTLDESLARAALKEASANLAVARSAYSRASRLNKEKLIAGADYDRTIAQVAVEEARVASAQATLSKLVLRAPFSGSIGLRSVAVGDVVSAGQDLVTLVRLDPMEIDFSVPESALADLQQGQRVTATVDAFPGEVFAAEVVAIDPVVDANSRSAKLRARIDNPDGRLRPGQFAQLQLETGTNAAKALLIPEQALMQDGDMRFVYTVVDGKAKRAIVHTGTRLPGQIAIVDGLKAGDVVITAGQTKPMMRDGLDVAPLPADGAAQAATPPASGAKDAAKGGETPAVEKEAPAQANAAEPAAQ